MTCFCPTVVGLFSTNILPWTQAQPRCGGIAMLQLRAESWPHAARYVETARLGRGTGWGCKPGLR
jgi:hypothetical protein